MKGGFLPAGTTVGDYKLVKPVGAGGFGAVYLAEHVPDGRQVALKLAHASRQSSENLERFRREVEALRRLNHPNVVKLFDVGRHDGRSFLVMEYLSGIGLDRFLAVQGRLPLVDALPILEPVCDALSRAHDAGLVHRDLKPSNIYLDKWRENAGLEGVRPVLLDFGLVKLSGNDVAPLTTSQHRIGTPIAMAPEQIAGRPVDARTDVYAAGNLAFRMLTGHLPFQDSCAETVQGMHLHARLPNPCSLAPIDPGVGAAIMRAMAKDPKNRFQTVLQFRDALRRQSDASASDDSVAALLPAVAIWLEVVAEPPEADVAETFFEDQEQVLSMVESFLTQAAFECAFSSSNQLLFMQKLEGGAAAVTELSELSDKLEKRPNAHPALRWKLCVHAAQSGMYEDGRWSEELIAVTSWVPAERQGLMITPAGQALLLLG